MLRFSTTTLAAMALVLAGCAPTQPGMAEIGRTTSVRVSTKKPDAPALVRRKNGRYRVTQLWTVALNGRLWHVEKGYTCNGITAPEQVRKSLGDGVKEPETWAAVFHDWLYTRPGMTRDRADRLFYDLLIAYGVPSVKARLMYSGVSAYSASKAIR